MRQALISSTIVMMQMMNVNLRAGTRLSGHVPQVPSGRLLKHLSRPGAGYVQSSDTTKE